MSWLIQNPEGFSKIQARKDASLEFRIDFSELRFVESSGVYSVYAVVMTKPEGTAALPKEKGAKWEPEYPLKVCFNLDSEGSVQEKAAVKALSKLDPSKAFSGYMCVQGSNPSAATVVSGKKGDGTDLPTDMIDFLLEQIAVFKETEPKEIKDDDVKPIAKANGFTKKFKSKGEIAQETFIGIKALLGKEVIEPEASFLEVVNVIDSLKEKDSVYRLLGILF
jgi:hypothetical protein